MRESIGIQAEAYYLPPTTAKVQEIFERENIPFGTLAKKVDFRNDIGIEEVHITDEMASEIALKAVQRVLEKDDLSGDSIDLIIDFTSLPEDYVGPTWSAAGIVQEAIGARDAFCTSVTVGGCASYHLALKTAWAMMSTDRNMKKALLFAADRTPELNKTYYPITVASDGGCALIISSKCERGEILAIETISVGRLHDVWYVPGLGQKHRFSGITTDRLLHMHCDMEKFNRGIITANFAMFNRIIRKILKRTNLELNDIDRFIYPTFSTWDQQYFCKATGISAERVYMRRLRERGHVQESDMVINYVDAVEDGFISKGNLVMLISNGAGFAWSAAIVRD